MIDGLLADADLTNQLAEQTESANQFRQWRDEWRDECERERREAFEQQHRVRVSREEERVECEFPLFPYLPQTPPISLG